MTNSLSRLLAFPFVVFIILFFTTDLITDDTIAFLLLGISIGTLVMIYIYHHQINHWWWKRKPPTLDPKIKALLNSYSSFYKSLSSFECERFDNRLAVFMKIKSFTLKRDKDYQLEEDVKAILSYGFIRLSLGRSDYLFESYDHFVVYDHPFASPNKEFLHSLEIHHEDGVIILSREQLINAFRDPSRYIDLSLMAACICFVNHNSTLFKDDSSWSPGNDYETISNQFQQLTGDDLLDPQVYMCYVYLQNLYLNFPGDQGFELPFLKES